MRFILSIFLLGLSFSCTEKGKNISIDQSYDGPVMEVDDMETLFTDSAVIKVKLRAKKELDFENGDKEFPEGVYIEFYEEGKITTTLKANTGFYTKSDDVYTGNGDVVVINMGERQQLNTEELYWKPKDETIFTEKFVRIETPNEILLGEGLIAHQDFKSYTILKPTGEILNVDEN